LVQSCFRPGVSVASTALANGINANLLRRWMVVYGPGGKSANAPGTSVSLVPVNTGSATLRAASSSDWSIEIIFMGATIRVRGTIDTRALRSVLDCLAQRA
jgi:transposase